VQLHNPPTIACGLTQTEAGFIAEAVAEPEHTAEYYIGDSSEGVRRMRRRETRGTGRSSDGAQIVDELRTTLAAYKAEGSRSVADACLALGLSCVR